MTVILLFLNFSLMLLLPVGLGWWIASRRRVDWSYFGVGVVGFVLSQVFHIPFNWLVLQKFAWLPTDTAVTANLILLAIFLGLSAGVFEEVMRALIYRFWLRDARTWGKGLMFGAGWGGIESILLGILGFYGLMQLVALQNNPALLQALPAEQLRLVQAQLAQIDTAPWYLFLLGAVERVFALTFHLSASLLVMQMFVRGQWRWLVYAILWHALLDATAVLGLQMLTPRLGGNEAALIVEGVIAVYALISLAIIFHLRTPEPAAIELEPLPTPTATGPKPVETTAEMLERSKYS